MPHPLSPTSLSPYRERAIEVLSIHFAHDRLTMDELDRRLERAYAATSVAELEALTADLPDATRAGVVQRRAQLPAGLDEPEEFGRIVALFSETRRGGLWAVPPRLDVKAMMSNLTLDLRSALLVPGVTDVQLSAVMASVQIVLPPGVRVVDRIRAFMASVTDDSYAVLTADDSIPVIRLNGYAFMSEVKVRTKGRTVEP
jgi:hypothetical protein